MAQLLRVVLGKFGRVALRALHVSLADHAHEDFHVILSQDEPGASFRVHGSAVPLDSEHAVLVTALKVHGYDHRASEPARAVVALYLDPAWLSGQDRVMRGRAHALFTGLPSVTLSDDAKALRDELFHRMLHERDSSGEVFERLVASLLGSMVRAPRAIRAGDQQSSVPSDARIRKAGAIMQSWDGAAFSLDELLDATHLSKSRLFDLFKQQTGMTPLAYYNTLRMERALDRVMTSRSTLDSIAEEVGFESAANLTRFFRGQIGLPPGEYRRVVEVVG